VNWRTFPSRQAQRAHRARQRLPVAGCGGERRDAFVDPVMFALKRSRQ